MKGINASVEFVGKILIVVFIIGMMVIILMSLLPTSVGLFCEQRQYENINSLIYDSTSARSIIVKTFSVEECVEHLDFSCEVGGSMCYKVKFEGREEMTVLVNLNRNLMQLDGNLNLEPGEYPVTIGPYSIKFPQQNS